MVADRSWMRSGGIFPDPEYGRLEGEKRGKRVVTPNVLAFSRGRRLSPVQWAGSILERAFIAGIMGEDLLQRLRNCQAPSPVWPSLGCKENSHEARSQLGSRRLYARR